MRKFFILTSYRDTVVQFPVADPGGGGGAGGATGARPL